MESSCWVLFVHLVTHKAHVPHIYVAVGTFVLRLLLHTNTAQSQPKELKSGTRHEVGMDAKAGRRDTPKKMGGRGSVQSLSSPTKDNSSAPPRSRIGWQLSIVEIRACAQDNQPPISLQRHSALYC